MAEPQTSTQTPEKEEKILFYRHYFIEFFKKKIYLDSEEIGETEEAKINGDVYRIHTDEQYTDILRSLEKKIDILPYVYSDETYEALRKEIVLDLVKIIYKLEKGQRF